MSETERITQEQFCAQQTPQKRGSRRKSAKRLSDLAPVRARFVERTAENGQRVFVLPLPPKKLSPNGREHWRYKAKAVKAYREQCHEWMLTQMRDVKPRDLPLFTDRVVVDLEFYLFRLPGDTMSHYPKDEDNGRAAMKTAQDALKDAGVIIGDGKKYVRVGETKLYTRAKEHQGFTCVVMTIRRESAI